MEDKSYSNFFGLLQKDIEGVTDYTAHYNNMRCVLQKKYFNRKIKEDETVTIEELDDKEKQAINDLTQNIRFYGTRAFTKLSSLRKIKEIEVNYKELEKLFNIISNEFSPSFETIQEFAILLNTILVGSVLHNLLMQSSDYMKQYSSQANEKELPNLDQF